MMRRAWHGSSISVASNSTRIPFVPAIWNIQTNCGSILTRFPELAGLMFVASRWRHRHSCKKYICKAGQKPAVHAECIFTFELNRDGHSQKCGAQPLRCRGLLSAVLRRLRVQNGGKKSATVYSSITTRTQKIAPRVRRTRCVQSLRSEEHT